MALGAPVSAIELPPPAITPSLVSRALNTSNFTLPTNVSILVLQAGEQSSYVNSDYVFESLSEVFYITPGSPYYCPSSDERWPCAAYEQPPPSPTAYIPSGNASSYNSSSGYPYGSGSEDTSSSSSPSRLEYILFAGGCNVTDSKEDCPAVCKNDTRVFSSLATLHNCAVAPLVIKSLDGSNSTNVNIAKRFGLTAHSDVNIINSTTQCFSSYYSQVAKQSPQGKAALESEFYSTQCNSDSLVNQLGYLNGSGLMACYGQICRLSGGSVDPDLGGIGVFISYLVQLGISLGGYLILELCTSWTCIIVRCLLVLKGRDFSRAWGHRVQESLASHRAPLLSALDEFHRTQCFFAGAIQIAALVIMRNNNFSVKQWGPITTNYSFIRVVAFNSIISVPFTFWYLRRNIKRSWYKFILTTVSFILSIITYATSTWKWYNTTPAVSDDGFSYCGNADPSKQCFNMRENDDLDSAALFILFSRSGAPILPSFFMGYLMVEYMFSGAITAHLSRRQWWQAMKADYNSQPFQRLKLRILCFLLFKTPFFGVILLFYVLQIVSLVSFLDGSINISDWNFGQVVGITVWLSAILEFVQLDLAGMKKGFGHRLPRGFALTEEDIGEEGSKNSGQEGDTMIKPASYDDSEDDLELTEWQAQA